MISSIPLRKWLIDLLPPGVRPPDGSGTDYLLSIVSSAQDLDSPAPSLVYARYVPLIPGYFSGVGDIFSALVIAHYEPSTSSAPGSAISWAVSQALAKTHAILCLTQEHAAQLPEEDRLPTDDELDEKEPARVVRRMKGRELRVIQGQDIIRSDRFTDARMELWEGFWGK